MGEVYTPRQLFAAIALVERPMPTVVRIWTDATGPQLDLKFTRQLDVRMWQGLLAEAGEVHVQTYKSELIYTCSGMWVRTGYRVNLSAIAQIEMAPAEELDNGVPQLLQHIMEVAGDDTN